MYPVNSEFTSEVGQNFLPSAVVIEQIDSRQGSDNSALILSQKCNP